MAMFSAKGLEATTVEDITERADVGKGTFYRHFASKDDITNALVEEAIDRLIHRIRGVKTPHQHMEGALGHLLSAHMAFYVENPTAFVLLQARLLARLQQETALEPEEPYTRFLNEIAQQISPYVGGTIDPDKLRRLARALAGFVSVLYPFSLIGMPSQEIHNSLEPLQRAFVTCASAFLRQ